MRRTVFLALVLGAFASGAARGATITNNVALGKAVSIIAGTQTNSAALSVVTDGTFAIETTAYHSTNGQTQAVDWGNAAFTLQITLGGTYRITGGIVQADDNDGYQLLFHNLGTGTWDTMMTIANVSFGLGLRTRPGFTDRSTLQALDSAMAFVDTDAVRIIGTNTLDQVPGYAVSEVQLQGSISPVPLPAASWAGLGLFGLMIPLKALHKRRLSFALSA